MSKPKDLHLFELRMWWSQMFTRCARRDYSIFDFCPKFFNSFYMICVDYRNPYYTSMPPGLIMKQLCEKEGFVIEPSKCEISEPLAIWLGTFYAEMLSKLEMTGKSLYKLLPAKGVLTIYPGIHDKTFSEIANMFRTGYAKCVDIEVYNEAIKDVGNNPYPKNDEEVIAMCKRFIDKYYYKGDDTVAISQ